jgi:hypothetical protein
MWKCPLLRSQQRLDSVHAPRTAADAGASQHIAGPHPAVSGVQRNRAPNVQPHHSGSVAVLPLIVCGLHCGVLLYSTDCVRLCGTLIVCCFTVCGSVSEVLSNTALFFVGPSMRDTERAADLNAAMLDAAIPTGDKVGGCHTVTLASA